MSSHTDRVCVPRACNATSPRLTRPLNPHPPTPNRYYFEITELLNTVPREMLLLLKMNDCLRHIDRELGAPVNSSCVVLSGCGCVGTGGNRSRPRVPWIDTTTKTT